MEPIILKQKKQEFTDSVVNLIVILLVPLLFVSISGVILSLLFHGVDSDFDSIIIIGLSMTIGFVFLPLLFVKKTYKANLYDLGIKPITFREILIEVIILLALFSYLGTKGFSLQFLLISCIQMLIVASAEEFWARGTICYLLGRLSQNKTFIIIISSCCFAFLTHMNEPIIDNLLYRLPGALVMGIIFIKTKNLRYTILFHFTYNLISL